MHRTLARAVSANEGGAIVVSSAVVAAPVSVRMSRRFSVSPEQLFDAWFQPACFASFLLADAAARVVRAHFDPRVGGRFLVVARRPDATVELRGRYVEIARPERLVFSLTTARDGRAQDYVTVELAALGRGCLLALLHEMDLERAHDRWRVQLGWNAALCQLAL
jgi:uncharacterized protein YndB with AHSA1/START domain